MNQSRFRNRVVGALVLVSLAVIFVPMILTGQGSLDVGSRGPAIPPEPDMKFSSQLVDKPLTDPVVVNPPSATVVEANSPDSAAPEDVTPSADANVDVASVQAPDPAESPNDVAVLPKGVAAWAVQVGSYTKKSAATSIRDKLRAKGFPAYIESVAVKNGTVYRVRVGPELQQSLAETLQERIAKETGQKGIVVSHR